jgi:hypothetical protein
MNMKCSLLFFFFLFLCVDSLNSILGFGN